MKMVITLRSGVQVRVDVDEGYAHRSLTNELMELSWTTSDDWRAKLSSVTLDQVDCVHFERDGKEDSEQGE